MRVFLCYDSEQRDLAQRVALALAGAGIEVFFDRDDLPPGGEFNLAIRNAIRRSDLFLFIASREALREGAYALTELGIARQRWPHPAERVLTLLADETPITALPAYLSAVTVLVPAGDPVAETVDAVARWRERARRRWLGRAAAVLAVVAAGAGLTLWLIEPRPVPSGPGTVADEAVTEVVDGVPNAHVYPLKNGRHVRLAGSVVRNDSNVAPSIIRKYIEWGAWRYNRCYDQHFGHLAGTMPEGKVDIAFEIFDQLPRHASVAQSDFAQAELGSCVQATLLGQTLNAAGPDGAGKVLYRFRFVPN
jgi:hypothetical protein